MWQSCSCWGNQRIPVAKPHRHKHAHTHRAILTATHCWLPRITMVTLTLFSPTRYLSINLNFQQQRLIDDLYVPILQKCTNSRPCSAWAETGIQLQRPRPTEKPCRPSSKKQPNRRNPDPLVSGMAESVGLLASWRQKG